MATRIECKDSLEFFPTPPWATRALMQEVLGLRGDWVTNDNCLEPACGKGHMAKTLKEYFPKVYSRDIYEYGYGDVKDFFEEKEKFDWIITNPPFNKAEDFVLHSLKIARYGVAIFERLTFLESVGRYKNLFSLHVPTFVAPFTERVPILKNRLEKNASSATAYAWFVWLRPFSSRYTKVKWIPPCRKKLERDSDYSLDNDLKMDYE